MSVNLSSPSWGPVGESSVDLFVERANLAGAFIGAVGYGAFAVLFFTALQYELRGKRSVGILVYLFLLAAAASVYMGVNTKWNEEMYIDYRNFHLQNTTADPEVTGPLGFYNLEYAIPIVAVGNSAYAILNFLADGLLVRI